ncbi:MAG: YfiR family protein [Cyclobacteriaceae bacterium]|nr:YfiR family protein [Cyclobacteriaceae bacterium]
MRMHQFFKIKKITVFALLMAFVASSTFAQESNLYRIQSLFLYNFTKHVKWENESSVFTIGIYGNPIAFAEIKANLENKIVWGKNINIIQINTPGEVKNCQIAYMPRSNKKKIVDLMSASDFNNTLVVTEEDMMEDGAAISFFFEQSSMKFKISKDKIEKCGLKVSSSLLSIGVPV